MFTDGNHIVYRYAVEHMHLASLYNSVIWGKSATTNTNVEHYIVCKTLLINHKNLPGCLSNCTFCIRKIFGGNWKQRKYIMAAQ